MNSVLLSLLLLLWLWLTLFVFNRIREHHGDWASSPFSYPELLAYLILFPSYVINVFLLLWFLCICYHCWWILSLIIVLMNVTVHCVTYLQVIRINIIIIIILLTISKLMSSTRLSVIRWSGGMIHEIIVCKVSYRGKVAGWVLVETELLTQDDTVQDQWMSSLCGYWHTVHAGWAVPLMFTSYLLRSKHWWASGNQHDFRIEINPERV